MAADSIHEVSGQGEGSSAGESEHRWPAVFAFVTTWLCPATSARRMQRVSLKSAFVVHILAGLMTFVLITVLTSLMDRRPPLKDLNEILEEFTSRWWKEAVAATCATVLAIEIAYLILAGLVMPWGAADERLRSSWKNALRFTWLHTTHALPTVLLVGVLGICFVNADRNYRRVNPHPGWVVTAPIPKPTFPRTATVGSQAWLDYQAEMEEYVKKQEKARDQQRKERMAWERNKPFMARFGPAIAIWIGTICSFWIVWAMLRAAGVRRAVPVIDRPPTCEFCGYNLIGTAAESRCPECGRAVVESLGADARPGTAWDRRHEVGRLKAWWRCSVDALFRPRRLGQQLKVTSQVHDHRSFLAGYLPLYFLLGAGGVLACLIMEWLRRRDSFPNFIEIAPAVPPIFGGMTALLMPGLAGLSASLVGLVYSLRNGRNLMPASMQISCYLGGYLTVWTAFGAALAVAAFWADEVHLIQDWARRQRADDEFLLFCAWLLPNVLFLFGYFYLVWRGTAAAQHANR